MRRILLNAGSEPTVDDTPDPERGLLAAARSGLWSLARLEREYILEVLRFTHGNRNRAAAILGIDRRTLYRKLKQYAGQDRARSIEVEAS